MLNLVAYQYLLHRREGWAELIDLSAKVGDWSYVRGLLRANLAALRPVAGNVETTSRGEVLFPVGCRDMIRRGLTNQFTEAPEWMGLEAQSPGDEPIDCFDYSDQTPCEVINSNDIAQDVLSAAEQRRNTAE